MAYTNNTATLTPATLETIQDPQQEQEDDVLSDISSTPDQDIENNEQEPTEISPADYKWIRDDSRIYKALESAARHEVKGTYLTDTHADFDNNIVFNLIKARTPYKNKHITPALKRLKKGKIWVEFSDSFRLIFVDNVKEFADDPMPEVISPNNLILPQAEPPLAQNMAVIHPPSSIQRQVLATALQAIQDAYADILAKVEDYNETIKWVGASFSGMLTSEEIESLKEKIIR